MTPNSRSLEERRLAFEARRLTIETVARIYLDHMQVARHFVVTYLRFIFTLSLGALAGLVTLCAAMLRVNAPPSSFGTREGIQAMLIMAALAALVTSAMFASAALRRIADATLSFLHNPFPKSGAEVDAIFQDAELDENEIMLKLYRAISAGLDMQPNFTTETRFSTACLLLGLLAAGVAFAI